MRAAVLAFALVLAACSKRDPVAKDANQGANALPLANEATTNAEGAPPLTTSGTPAVDNSAPAKAINPKSIPFLLHGRWGLTPEDCMSTRGDAKGLLVISDEGLRFYESRAIPTANTTKAGDSISGDFQFTGEGQSWTRFEALERRAEGLVRTERNPNASFTYARCD